ncbi:MAG: hypothetical protein FD166_3616 [Bacteroidetes bacterium]|nr:MAG: hypothetical protein FD166_3616 [Bacteroidota bacterium]
MDSEKLDPQMAAEKDKILKYLNEQLTLKLAALESMEQPIKVEALQDIKQLEEIILKREIYDLRRHIQVIQMM